jgi:hypothetical protein
MSNALPATRTGWREGNDQTSALNISGAIFSWLSSVTHNNIWLIPGIGQNVFVPNPFPFISPLTIDVTGLKREWWRRSINNTRKKEVEIQVYQSRRRVIPLDLNLQQHADRTSAI